MKQLLLLLTFLVTTQVAFSQNRSLPKVDLKTMDNTSTSTAAFDNDGKPIVISFGLPGVSHA